MTVLGSNLILERAFDNAFHDTALQCNREFRMIINFGVKFLTAVQRNMKDSE